LVISSIAANWGAAPQNLPFPWGDHSPCLTMLLEITRVSLPNGTPHSVQQMVDESDRQHTDGQTDHATVTSVATGGITYSDRCIKINSIT